MRLYSAQRRTGYSQQRDHSDELPERTHNDYLDNHDSMP
jgi:hypothetical protein